HYIEAEHIPVPPLYFAHQRDVIERGGILLAHTPHVGRRPDEAVTRRTVRFRTVGDVTCTGALESNAATVAEVINEISNAAVSERGGRADDQRSDTAIEDRK